MVNERGGEHYFDKPNVVGKSSFPLVRVVLLSTRGEVAQDRVGRDRGEGEQPPGRQTLVTSKNTWIVSSCDTALCEKPKRSLSRRRNSPSDFLNPSIFYHVIFSCCLTSFGGLLSGFTRHFRATKRNCDAKFWTDLKIDDDVFCFVPLQRACGIAKNNGASKG